MALIHPTERVPRSTGFGRVGSVAALTALALIIIDAAFDYALAENCATVGSWRFCRFSAEIIPRSASAGVVLMLFAWARPGIASPILAAAPDPGGLTTSLWLVSLGLAFALAAAALIGPDAVGRPLLAGLFSWTAGACLLAAGLARLLAPWAAWAQTLRAAFGADLARAGLPLAACLAVAFFLPEIGDLLLPFWRDETVAGVTFGGVLGLSHLLGLGFERVAGHTLGSDGFLVEINQSCSGIEGFALITAFLAGYLILFRRQLAFPQVLLLLPVGLALSWALNVARITALTWIGATVSPALALEAFHSYAGWLMFTGLAIGMIFVAQSTPWLQRRPATVAAEPAPRTSLPPISEDWNAARLLPFAVFMGAALLASTFFLEPEIAYPLRFAAVVATLWMFRGLIRAIAWRLSPAALAAGALIGVAWLATSADHVPGGLDEALSELGAVAFAIWVASRVLATALAVPLIEELFFRSYLPERLGAGRSTALTILAIGLSTAAFAWLHDRWVAAALAGLVFAWLAYRPGGRLSDAIVAHAVANALIAGYALTRGEWSAI